MMKSARRRSRRGNQRSIRRSLFANWAPLVGSVTVGRIAWVMGGTSLWASSLDESARRVSLKSYVNLTRGVAPRTTWRRFWRYATSNLSISSDNGYGCPLSKSHARSSPLCELDIAGLPRGHRDGRNASIWLVISALRRAASLQLDRVLQAL